jgi:hypothetical protein
MVDDEPHAVVRLLLKRMESHPEEFKIGEGIFHQRWSHHVDIVQDNGSEADKAALNAKLRDILMNELHEQVMDELVNGPERRRKEEEERDYERNLSKSLQSMKQQQLRVGTLSGDMNPIGNGGTGASIARYPTSADMEQNGIMNSLRNILK